MIFSSPGGFRRLSHCLAKGKIRLLGEWYVIYILFVLLVEIDLVFFLSYLDEHGFNIMTFILYLNYIIFGYILYLDCILVLSCEFHEVNLN